MARIAAVQFSREAVYELILPARSEELLGPEVSLHVGQSIAFDMWQGLTLGTIGPSLYQDGPPPWRTRSRLSYATR